MDDAPDPTVNLFQIDWNRHSAAQWQTMLDSCARPTLTQSPAYAAAAAEVEGTTADYGLIRFQGKPIGMAIVTRRRTFGGAASCSLYCSPRRVVVYMGLSEPSVFRHSRMGHAR